MATNVTNEIIWLQQKMEEIEARQREKDKSQGKDPNYTAKQRVKGMLDNGDIMISSSDTEKHENVIKVIRSKFAQLHKLMDSLNKIAEDLTVLQPHLKTLQDSPQRRKAVDATSEEVYAEVDFQYLDDMLEDAIDKVQKSVFLTPYNLVMAGVICFSVYLHSNIARYVPK